MRDCHKDRCQTWKWVRKRYLGGQNLSHLSVISFHTAFSGHLKLPVNMYVLLWKDITIEFYQLEKIIPFYISLQVYISHEMAKRSRQNFCIWEQNSTWIFCCRQDTGYENTSCLCNALILIFPARSLLPVEFYRRIVEGNECLALLNSTFFFTSQSNMYHPTKWCRENKTIPGPMAFIYIAFM